MPGRGEYLNEKALAKPTSSISASVVREISLRLAGKADDEIGRQRDVGPRGAEALDDARDNPPPVCLRFIAGEHCGPSPTAPADAGTA